jgi:hypothetical protein
VAIEIDIVSDVLFTTTTDSTPGAADMGSYSMENTLTSPLGSGQDGSKEDPELEHENTILANSSPEQYDDG